MPKPRNSPRRTALTQEGWYYLLVLSLVFLAAMLREVNLLLILAGMLAGPLLFSWRLAATTLRQLRLRRKMPREVCAGDLLVVSVELANQRRRLGAWAVAVEDPVRRQSNGLTEEMFAPAVFFTYVPAGQSRKMVYRGRLTRRGRYQLGPWRVSTRFPFGLVSCTLTLGEPQWLTVFPRLGRLTQGWIARRLETFEGTSRRERQPSRMSGDFYGVRPWRHGDSPRWVHWRSSARQGTLVVRQFEQLHNRDVAVLVDLWQPASPREEHAENVELAVSLAATLMDDICRKGGSNVLLMLGGLEADCVAGPASAGALKAAMEKLAVAEASPGDGLAELVDAALNRVQPGTEVVLVTTRSVDPGESRFAAIGRDPGRRAALRRIRVINTAGEGLSEYFEP